MANPDRIWLQDEKDALAIGEGRCWCEDKVWPEVPEQNEPVAYVRADLVDADRSELLERIFMLTAENKLLKAAESGPYQVPGRIGYVVAYVNDEGFILHRSRFQSWWQAHCCKIEWEKKSAASSIADHWNVAILPVYAYSATAQETINGLESALGEMRRERDQLQMRLNMRD